MTRDEFKAELDRRYKRADRGTKAWSTAFHTTFGVAIVTGALVAAVTGKAVNINSFDLTPYVPFIAMLGTVCSAIGGFGGFERKWQANRITRNEIDILRIKLASRNDSDPLMDQLADQLVEILRAHDAGILQRTSKPTIVPEAPELETVKP